MEFNERCAMLAEANLRRRVNYQYGMVLGVGEFRTEQDYFLGKIRSHNRALHGYGTLAGLAVDVDGTGGNPELSVTPGLAVDAHGNEICVPERQCGRINDWLQDRAQGNLPPPALSPPSNMELFLTLCHRQCEVGPVDVPVGACHSLDRASVSSRIEDAFRLELAERLPDQAELDGIRALTEIMSRVRVDAMGSTDPRVLLDEIEALAPSSTPSGPASPMIEIALHPDIAQDALRAAVRIWITRVRPLLVPDAVCLSGPRDRTCVLLARLEFDVVDVGAGVLAVNGPVTIDESARPFVVQTQLLQNLFFGVLGGV